MNYTEKKEFWWFQCQECLLQFDNMNEAMNHTDSTGHRKFIEVNGVTLRKAPERRVKCM